MTQPVTNDRLPNVNAAIGVAQMENFLNT